MNDTHFGPVIVSLDHQGKRATLTLRRGRDPLPTRTVLGLLNWALKIIEADHPTYRVFDETGLGNGN
jgi:hypothetical protein